MDEQKEEISEGVVLPCQQKQQPSYNPNGSFKIRLEAKKGETENLERLLRLIQILNITTNENRIEQDDSLVIELNVGERRKLEIPVKNQYEVQIPDSDAKVRINIEKLKPKILQFNLIARQSGISKDRLESLVNSINLLGKTSSLQETFSVNGKEAYKISFVLDTDVHGTNFIDAIKEMIEDAKFLLKYEGIKRELITNVDAYLGKWKGGSFGQRLKIASDIKEMYEVLQRDYKIPMKDILSSYKGLKIAKARAAIAYILYQKNYNENRKKLSSTAIGEILDKNHATVLLGIGRCKEVELTQNDLDDFSTAFKKIFIGYKRGAERKQIKKQVNINPK